MRIAIIINSKAGSVNEVLVEEKIREALFRCELIFCVPKSLDEMDRFIDAEVGQANYVIICGGDGTVNVTLQSLLRHCRGQELPPLCLIRSGTANDLAVEIGVSRKIENAARAILEGTIKKIDLIELESENGEKAFMLTNGGIGLPASVADSSNQFRSALQVLSHPAAQKSIPTRILARQSYKMIKKMGSGVYSMMAFDAIRRWTDEDWEVEIEIPERETIISKASCIFISNQRTIGQHMTTAPFTSNSDGLVNLLVVEANTLKKQLQTVLSLRRGNPDDLAISENFEVSHFRLKSRDGQRSLTFFGDGEILLKDVREINVRCRHQGLSVVVRI